MLLRTDSLNGWSVHRLSACCPPLPDNSVSTEDLDLLVRHTTNTLEAPI